jgi:molybdopterin converting factor subunit 1
VRILYFAQARLATTLSEENLKTSSNISAEKLWKELIKRHPKLAALQSSCRLARNGHFLSQGETLEPGDEVAVLPPVSGG